MVDKFLSENVYFEIDWDNVQLQICITSCSFPVSDYRIIVFFG